MKQLVKNNNVTFREAEHQYLYSDEDFNTRELYGITGMIKKCICPDLYSDIDEATLAKAAAHGTRCHRLCEAFDNAELEPTDDGKYVARKPIITYNKDNTENVLVAEGEYIDDVELYNYINLIAAKDLFVEASEYLVSDNVNFASCIDKIIRESENEISICDLKFTYAYHEEPVRWQTSFYADMFELQNPGMKVKHLYCIHIHAYKDGKIKCDLHKLKRIKTEILDECKRCFLSDQPFDNPLSKVSMDLPLELAQRADSIRDIIEREKQLASQKKLIMEEFKTIFADNPNVNKLEHPLFCVNRSTASTTIAFDIDGFRKDNPELYLKYMRQVKQVPSKTTISLTKK